MGERRGAVLADFLHHFGATPFELWRRGMHLVDVAGLLDQIPGQDSAIAREEHPEQVDWLPAETQLLAEVVNAVRDLHWQVVSIVSRKPIPRPKRIGPPGRDRLDAGVQVETIRVQGFDSFAEVDEWYRKRFPDKEVT